MSIKNPRETIERRRELRRLQTRAEEVFWEKVRGKQVGGVRFKRQYGIGPYILDFYIPELSIAIEIDGGIHELDHVKTKDQNKDAFLEDNGIKVLRFKNEEVLNNMDEVFQTIEELVGN